MFLYTYIFIYEYRTPIIATIRSSYLGYSIPRYNLFFPSSSSSLSNYKNNNNTSLYTKNKSYFHTSSSFPRRDEPRTPNGSSAYSSSPVEWNVGKRKKKKVSEILEYNDIFSQHYEYSSDKRDREEFQRQQKEDTAVWKCITEMQSLVEEDK